MCVPVGCPWNLTTMSSRGPPEACAIGITPAACVMSAFKLRGSWGAYHKFNYVDAEVLVQHSIEPYASAP